MDKTMNSVINEICHKNNLIELVCTRQRELGDPVFSTSSIRGYSIRGLESMSKDLGLRQAKQ